MHQQDPVATVRRAAAAVRRGGTIAFHELLPHVGGAVFPDFDLLNRTVEAVGAASRAAFLSWDVARRLVACYEDAGLGEPHLIWESIAGGPSAPIIPWLVMTYRALLPVIERLGLEHANVGDPETLEARLMAAATAARAQIVSPPQACAWARRG
jgi:hypothetical protein